MAETWTLPFAGGDASTGFALDDLTLALLVGSVVLVVAVAAVRLSVRSGLPSLLIYLGIGLVLGEAGFGIQYENQQLTQVLGYSALVLILIEGGLTTRWSRHQTVGRDRPWCWRRSGSRCRCSSSGWRRTSCSAWTWQVAFLVGRGAGLDRCRGGLLGAASGAAPPADLGRARGRVGLQRRARRAAGHGDRRRAWPRGDARPVVAGRRPGRARAGRRCRDRPGHRLGRCPAAPAGGVHVVRTVRDRRRLGGRARLRRRPPRCTPPASSPATSRPWCSGNLRLPHRPAVVGFATAIGWLAQIGLFVLLGLLANPGKFVDVLVPALVVGAALLLLGRPLSVLASLPAVRDVVAHPGLPVVGGAARRGARRARDRARPPSVRPGCRGSSTWCSCWSSSSPSSRRRPCRGWRGGWASPRPTTGSTSTSRRRPSTSWAPSCSRSTSGRDRGSPGCGCSSCGCRWAPTSPSSCARVRSFVPRDNDVLRHGDQLLVVAPSTVRETTERRLHAVSRGGRLADWP